MNGLSRRSTRSCESCAMRARPARPGWDWLAGVRPLRGALERLGAGGHADAAAVQSRRLRPRQRADHGRGTVRRAGRRGGGDLRRVLDRFRLNARRRARRRRPRRRCTGGRRAGSRWRALTPCPARASSRPSPLMDTMAEPAGASPRPARSPSASRTSWSWMASIPISASVLSELTAPIQANHAGTCRSAGRCWRG